MATLNKQSVKAAVDLSRQRLGVDQIDLMQLYWGDYSYPKYVDAALYLTELQADGVLGAVGVTNFDVPRLEAMVNKGAQLVSNQVGVWVAATVGALHTARSSCTGGSNSVQLFDSQQSALSACVAVIFCMLLGQASHCDLSLPGPPHP